MLDNRISFFATPTFFTCLSVPTSGFFDDDDDVTLRCETGIVARLRAGDTGLTGGVAARCLLMGGRMGPTGGVVPRCLRAGDTGGVAARCFRVGDNGVGVVLGVVTGELRDDLRLTVAVGVIGLFGSGEMSRLVRNLFGEGSADRGRD